MFHFKKLEEKCKVIYTENKQTGNNDMSRDKQNRSQRKLKRVIKLPTT